ncbi:ATP-dependent helicase fft2 [Seiridium cupressi]
MARSIPGLRTSSPALPGTPPGSNGAKKARFEIEDEDLDELAHSIPDSSPYFTQPTQIVKRTTQPTQIIEKTTQPTQIINRTTQPTQIVEGRTTLSRSSPPIPDTPGSVVEVPASSPFQTMSQTRRPAVHMGSPGVKGPQSGRLDSLMAPAGTAFRQPAAVIPRRPQPAIKRQFLSTINSDDDLANDYKRLDSSDDDDTPMRGEIRPSSFVKKPQFSMPVSRHSIQKEDKDITLNNISDIRLRYLTKQVYKCVVKSNPDVLYRQCRDELQNNGMSVEEATHSLLGETRSIPVPSRADSDSKSESQNASARGTIVKQQPPKIWSQTKLSIAPKPRAPSSSPPPSPELAKNIVPRRRLMKGRRNRSPSPDKVFSVSSSHASSTATSPARSSPEKSANMAVGAVPPAKSLSQDIANRRRLAHNALKNPQSAPTSEVITIDSESEDNDLPSLDKIASRKRKLLSSAENSPEVKKRSRLITQGEKLKPKAEPIVVQLSDHETFMDEVQSDDSGAGDPLHVAPEEHENVLEYLNTCTPDALARMTGSTAKDSQLVISKRPFQSIAEVEKIRTTKGAKNRSKQGDIGLNMIDKLDTWYKAFDAVTTVINSCVNRGNQLKSIMAKWEMDPNGKPQKSQSGAQSYSALPIPERPSFMADDVELKSYQQFGLNWMNLLHKLGYSAILADDMGLGKTCQVISFVSYLVEKKPNAKPHLIVVPPSTLENWVNEFERFAPDINIHLYSGNDRKEFRPREVAQAYDVVLTSYSMVERKIEDIEWLSKLDPYAAVFDEGHKLKNPNTLLYKNLSRLPSRWRLVLTGTPVQNNLKELLGLLSFVEPSLFESATLEKMHKIFEAKVPNKDVLNFAALAKERVSNARAIMAPFILQRRKDQVLGLPKRVDDYKLIKMTGCQKTLYEEIKDNFLSGKGKGRANKDKGNLWQQLRKAAIHPQLFRRHFTEEIVTEMVDILWEKCSENELNVQSKAERHKVMFREARLEESDFNLHLLCKEFSKYISQFDVPYRSWEEAPKVQKLLELIRGYQERGDRCLVFSRFEMAIDILRETMHFAEIPYCELTGRSNVSERFPEIERFNENPDIPVFLLTTGAGGTGLNLTAANKIILFDQSDNPQDDVQASNRAHRIGQTREVEVLRLLTEGTVETMIYNSCIKKLTLAASVEGAIEDEESLEDQCRKKMLLGEEEEVVMPPSQMVTLSQTIE